MLPRRPVRGRGSRPSPVRTPGCCFRLPAARRPRRRVRTSARSPASPSVRRRRHGRRPRRRRRCPCSRCCVPDVRRDLARGEPAGGSALGADAPVDGHPAGRRPTTAGDGRRVGAGRDREYGQRGRGQDRSDAPRMQRSTPFAESAVSPPTMARVGPQGRASAGSFARTESWWVSAQCFIEAARRSSTPPARHPAGAAQCGWVCRRPERAISRRRSGVVLPSPATCASSS